MSPISGTSCNERRIAFCIRTPHAREEEPSALLPSTKKSANAPVKNKLVGRSREYLDEQWLLPQREGTRFDEDEDEASLWCSLIRRVDLAWSSGPGQDCQVLHSLCCPWPKRCQVVIPCDPAHNSDAVMCGKNAIPKEFEESPNLVLRVFVSSARDWQEFRLLAGQDTQIMVNI